jgi:hypothetical protein
MKFKIHNPVRLTAKKKILTKSEKEMTFVTIADTSTFEVLTTVLALAEGQSDTEIVEQLNYSAVVDYDGTWGSVTLTPTK